MDNIGIFREFQKLCKNERKPKLELIKKMVDNGIFLTENQFYYFLNYQDLKVIGTSPQVEKILGVKPEDFTLQKHLELVHPDDVMLVNTIVRTGLLWCRTHPVVPIETVFMVEYRIRHNDLGHYFKVQRQVIFLDVSDKNLLLITMGIITNIEGIKKDDKVRYDTEGPGVEGFFVPEIDQTIDVTLSKREVMVLKLMAEGLSSKKISEKLFITKSTVDGHRRNMLRKTGLKTSIELIVYGIQKSII